ncbi:MAG: hypothetical protein KatS3mg031_2724 [Chitinophagales bacterium]|nr:MAG: hypothetical protein KatS3mg031_2724 [Chitinophagales bacterium]
MHKYKTHKLFTCCNAAVKGGVALLLLIAFLLPQAEKIIHDFHHLNDYRCTEKSAAHYHEEAHHCAFCHALIFPGDQGFYTDKLAQISGCFLFTHLNNPFTPRCNNSTVSLRGPPFCI